MDENKDDILIKAFIRKCTAHVRYEYYAKKASEEGFLTVSDKLRELSTNELYHAYALLKRLGADQNTQTNLSDALDGEERDVASLKKLIGENNEYNDVLEPICRIDTEHLSTLKNLEQSMKSETAYTKKKCALCGRIDKSGNIQNVCPLCANKIET